MSTCHIVQVRSNLMESIIPNALMKWNSAFVTHGHPPTPVLCYCISILFERKNNCNRSQMTLCPQTLKCKIPITTCNCPIALTIDTGCNIWGNIHHFVHDNTEWVRTSDPVIRIPAHYRWTTAPACIPYRWNTIGPNIFVWFLSNLRCITI